MAMEAQSRRQPIKLFFLISFCSFFFLFPICAFRPSRKEDRDCGSVIFYAIYYVLNIFCYFLIFYHWIPRLNSHLSSE